MKCPICKKIIPENSLKCPHCGTRAGLLCDNCKTVNPVGSMVCKNCSKELLKVCSRCKSVNFPTAEKCRKCGSPFSVKKDDEDKNKKNILPESLAFVPELVSQDDAIPILFEGLRSKDKKLFSITGEKGIGKTTLLNKVIAECIKKEKFKWCIGKCTQLTDRKSVV